MAPAGDVVREPVNEGARFLLFAAVLGLPLLSNVVFKGRLAVAGVMVGLAFLAVAVIATAVAIKERRIPLSAAVLAGLVLAPAMLVSLIASPSGAGMTLVVFSFIAAGTVLAVASLDRQGLQRLVALPLLLTSGIQAILVVVQTVTDRPFGLTIFESGAQLKLIDGLLRPQGTMSHVYEPAALALLALGVGLTTIPRGGALRKVWFACFALCGVTVGSTHSRAALLGLILIVICVGIAHLRGNDGAAILGGAILLGFVIAAGFTATAWMSRTNDSTTGGFDDVTLGRITLAKQGVQMALDHPLLGVGPVQYLDTMHREYQLDARYPFEVHNVSLLVAAENGIAVAVVASILVGLAMAAAIRAGPLSAALALSIVGFLLFDFIHYDRPVGLMMTAIWLGAMHVSTVDQRSDHTNATTP